MSRKGVTFIELLLVLVIIGFMATLSLPFMRKSFDNLETENMAKEIYSLSNFLQARAVAEEKIYCLKIDPSKGELQAFCQEAGALQALSGRLGKMYTLGPGTQLSLSPSDATQAYFYPNGSSDRLTLTLRNAHNKSFSILLKGITNELKEQ
jgi:prepilin-type N-terminal cleavage/methylation domain-containing protein